MKTNEFLEKLNRIAYTSSNGKVIKVYAQNNWKLGNEDDWFLKINPSVSGPIIDKRWKNLEGYPIVFLRELLNLIAKLEETPIKERLSEKKYTIQVLYNDSQSYLVKTSNEKYFFGSLGMKNAYGDQVSFTQEEIDLLKNNDCIAIDWDKATIKPVNNKPVNND